MAAQTILIAEDDPDIRDGVRILLAGEGYHILEAENGTRALEIFNPEVDLVILDIMMPGMSGLRVCEELRKGSTVPILFLTAKSQESDKLLGLTAGGDLALVDAALEAEHGAHGGGGHAVLAGAGLGDHAGLAHALDEQGLAERVVDLVRAGVVQILTL